MSKTICDWSKKEIEKKASLLYEITRYAHLYCRKCGRVANKKKVLCKPEPFETKLDD